MGTCIRPGVGAQGREGWAALNYNKCREWVQRTPGRRSCGYGAVVAGVCGGGRGPCCQGKRLRQSSRVSSDQCPAQVLWLLGDVPGPCPIPVLAAGVRFLVPRLSGIKEGPSGCPGDPQTGPVSGVSACLKEERRECACEKGSSSIGSSLSVSQSR